MADAVLDASALFALLQDEPGSDVVAARLPGAAISAVNFSEVIAKLAEAGMQEVEIRRALAPLGLDVHAFTQEDAVAAGLLRPQTKALGLSLGDRACLALGWSLAAGSNDRPRVARLKIDVEIILARILTVTARRCSRSC